MKIDWSFLKSRVFWVAVITVGVNLGNWLLGQAFYPSIQVPIQIAVAFLGFLLTAVSGTTASVKLAKANIALAKANSCINILRARK